MISLDLPFAISLFGLLIFAYRLQPWPQKLNRPAHEMKDWPLVSILIPCRNEEKNLANLLTSLKTLKYPRLEIIVIDDQSEDRTFEIAQSFGVTVLKAPEKPSHWSGKNWPCAIGAQVAKGSLLLFTDADTVHAPDSLKKSVTYLYDHQADFLSAPPHHFCKNPWEKGLGLFHSLPLIATAFRQLPQAQRLFAIGQYLFITKLSYEELGGHGAIAPSLVDDLDLAKRWLENGKVYRVYPETSLYQVQMYANFPKFLKGWKRLLRLGMHRSTAGSFVETTAVLYLFSLSWLSWRVDLVVLFFLGLALLAISQQRIGQFSILGLMMAPLNVFLFIALSLSASAEALLRKDIEWHGRRYQRF